VVKIQIFSDLHADVNKTKPIAIGSDVDVVAVAGDIMEGAENSFVTLRTIVPESVPIIMTMGNHEYYHRFLGEELEFAMAIAPNFNIRLLENSSTVITSRTAIDKVVFCGASLWTDYRLFGDHNACAAMHAARLGMNDHRLIGWKRDPWLRFRPQEAAMLHARSRAFFAEALATVPPDDASPVVFLSHHAPDFRSVAPRHATDILTAAFASNMLVELLGETPDRKLIDADRDIDPKNSQSNNSGPRIDLFIHGHVHNSADYRVGRTRVRVICNPHGYGNENPSFNPSLVVEI
jgi:predicted phosphodiesterase